MRAACGPMRDLLAERALGILDDGDAAALDHHLARCPACRDELRDLESTVDAVTLAGPLDARPAGSPSPVRAVPDGPAAAPDGPGDGGDGGATGPSPVTGPRRRALALVAAAALVAGVAAGALVAVPLLTGRDDDEVPSRAAPLRNGEGEPRGEVVIYGRPPMMALHLTRYRPGVPYTCELVLDDGTVVPLGEWATEDGAWSGPLDLDVGVERVDRVRVRSLEGRLLAD
ncbi:MAG: zf-HC2 domain-containing protein, partial [Acidimicrobiia bacterium]